MKKNTLKNHNYTAYLYPTLNCNLNCKMCYSGGSKNRFNPIEGELTKAQYFELIDELYSCGIRHFDISGGEPLIREDLVHIIDYIKSYEDTKLFLVSNGTLVKNLDAIKINNLKKADKFYVSLDSPKAKEHNSIRNVDQAFERTIEGIKVLKSNGFNQLGVNFVVMNSNKNSITELLEFCQENQIKYVNLLRLIDNSSDLNLKSESLDRSSYGSIFVEISKWIEQKNKNDLANDMEIVFVLPGFMMKEMIQTKSRLDKNRIKLRLEYDPLRGCKAFEHSVVISSTGDVTGCTGMIGNKKFDAGNVKFESFNKISLKLDQIKEDIIKKREKILEKKGTCKNCEEWHICRGGCPLVALKYTGEIFSSDPSCKWEV